MDDANSRIRERERERETANKGDISRRGRTITRPVVDRFIFRGARREKTSESFINGRFLLLQFQSLFLCAPKIRTQTSSLYRYTRFFLDTHTKRTRHSSLRYIRSSVRRTLCIQSSNLLLMRQRLHRLWNTLGMQVQPAQRAAETTRAAKASRLVRVYTVHTYSCRIDGDENVTAKFDVCAARIQKKNVDFASKICFRDRFDLIN